ncbi:unnamed protein product [Rotaria sp. Silwood2]|nr:unnamed protein product [Rotaria sp. Silwood2]
MTNLLRTCVHTLWKLVQLILFIVIAPPLINYASLKREAPLLGQHGLPYDIGYGQKLFLCCRGHGLFLMVQLGMNSDIWLPLQENLQKITTVCIYDRAGLAMSNAPLSSTIKQKLDDKEQTTVKHRGMDFTVERMSEDLNRLISAASQQPKPFILVGADLGTIVARFYAQMYELYNKIIPHLHAMQLSAAIGINRILVLTRMIDPLLIIQTSADSDDDEV